MPQRRSADGHELGGCAGGAPSLRAQPIDRRAGRCNACELPHVRARQAHAEIEPRAGNVPDMATHHHAGLRHFVHGFSDLTEPAGKHRAENEIVRLTGRRKSLARTDASSAVPANSKATQSLGRGLLERRSQSALSALTR